MNQLHLPTAWIMTVLSDEISDNEIFNTFVPKDVKEGEIIYFYNADTNYISSENEVISIIVDDEDESFNDANLLRKRVLNSDAKLYFSSLIKDGIISNADPQFDKLLDSAIIKLKAIMGDTSYKEKWDENQNTIKSKLRINFNTSYDEFECAMNLLDNNGFCNGLTQPHDRSIIARAFDRKGFVVIYYQGVLIGFTTWIKWENTAEIQYKWISPQYRGIGIGKLSSQLLYAELRKKQMYNLIAEPASEYGHAMARTMGFKSLSETPYQDSNKFYYKHNKKRRQSRIRTNIGYELTIWAQATHYPNCQYHECYSLDENLNRLPILTVVDKDSMVEITKDGKSLSACTVKRFFQEDEFQYWGFLYISSPLSKFLTDHGILMAEH